MYRILLAAVISLCGTSAFAQQVQCEEGTTLFQHEAPLDKAVSYDLVTVATLARAVGISFKHVANVRDPELIALIQDGSLQSVPVANGQAMRLIVRSLKLTFIGGHNSGQTPSIAGCLSYK